MSKSLQTTCSFDRRAFLAASGLGAAALLASRSGAYAAARPNVIVIITDDQGYGDLGCTGNPVVKTPHIDALHGESIRFTDFHVAPVCTPTRGQLMTGMDALRNGALTVPAGHNIIRREVPIMPELFRDNGYRTGHFGKWHLGDTYPDRPLDRGFEKCIWLHGHGVQTSIDFDNDTVNSRYMDGTEISHARKYNTDFYFDEAIAWMKRQQRQRQQAPFFAYIATTAPHGPLWALDRDVAPYRGQVPENVAAFYGMISNIDDNVGKLRAWLAAAGIDRNTILVIMNDNGGTTGVQTYNAGLLRGKSSSYDGGHRAFCFVYWPEGGFGQPRDVTPPTQVQDILPTLAALCGLKIPEQAKFDGISLDNLLRDPGAALPDRKLVVQFGGRVSPTKWEGCVIWGKWRLVGENELYDIEADREQAINVADAHPEVLAAMRAHYEKWWAEVSPIAYQYQPVLIGAEQQNPVILTSNTWEGQDVDNPRRVAEAAGGPKGGPWNVEVVRAGMYRVELRRWPFHINCPLDAPVPEVTVSGRDIQIGENKALPIAGAVLEFGNERHEAECVPGALQVSFMLELPEGRSKLWGWFRDAQGNDLCGAYYARVRLL